jgi:hypothetical protein
VIVAEYQRDVVFVAYRLLVVVWLVAPAIVAYRKGYIVWPWLLGFGLIGVFVLAFFPIRKRVKFEQDRQRYQVVANAFGNFLSVSQLIVFVCAPRYWLDLALGR